MVKYTHNCGEDLEPERSQDAWVAQLVKYATSAQVMIPLFLGSSPAWGSLLTAQSLEPASDSVSPSLCSSPTYTVSLSVSLSRACALKNKKKKQQQQQQKEAIALHVCHSHVCEGR